MIVFSSFMAEYSFRTPTPVMVAVYTTNRSAGIYCTTEKASVSWRHSHRTTVHGRPPEKQFLLLFVCLFVFFSFLITGYGLKCYQCLSTMSWDDCASNKKEQNCPSGTDTSAKIFSERTTGNFSATTHKMYASTCGIKSLCNQNLCKTIDRQRFTVNKCEVDCCDDDLCNEPKVSLMNAFIL